MLIELLLVAVEEPTSVKRFKIEINFLAKLNDFHITLMIFIFKQTFNCKKWATDNYSEQNCEPSNRKSNNVLVSHFREYKLKVVSYKVTNKLRSQFVSFSSN